MYEITFGWTTGKSLDAGVYAPDGTRRENPDVDLVEIGATGLYVGSSTNIETGDLVIVDDGTTQVGWGEYQPTINLRDSQYNNLVVLALKELGYIEMLIKGQTRQLYVYDER